MTHPRTATRPRSLDLLLGLAALLAAVVYMLSCRPAWSPDGSQLVFSAQDSQTKRGALMLHDLPTGQTRAIAEPADGWAMQALWLNERELVALYPVLATNENEFLRVARVDVETGRITPIRDFADVDVEACLRLPPVCRDGTYLWFNLARINLKTGAYQEVLGEETHPQQVGRDIYYLREQDDFGGTARYQLLKVESDSLALRSLGYFDADEHGHLLQMIGGTLDGRHLVLVTKPNSAYGVDTARHEPPTPALLILNRRGAFERRLDLSNVASQVHGICAGPKPGTVWAAAQLRSASPELGDAPGLLEIDLNDDHVYVLPLSATGTHEPAWSVETMLPSLAPGHDYLAVWATTLDDTETSVLWLVDLRQPRALRSARQAWRSPSLTALPTEPDEVEPMGHEDASNE